MPRRAPLVVALVLVLAASATLTSLLAPANPAALPTGLAVSAHVESSALYCTGLSDAAGAVPGTVELLNTGAATRTVLVSVVSDTGARAGETVSLTGYAKVSLTPAQMVAGHSFGVSAVVDGGGVVASEVTAARTSVVACPSDAVTSWYASGLDTSVGSSAALSFYNPTATPAVVNVTADTPSGFVAPVSFQGLPVGAHAEVVLNLGGQIVNTRNVGVRVNVVRGSLVIAGVERSGTVGSLDAGSVGPSATAWFPAVTTADQAQAAISIANPGPGVARVTLHVALDTFHVPDQSVEVAPYSSTSVALTPNSAIPAAGLAVVRLASSVPVVATLAAGTGAGVALTPAPAPGSLLLLADLGTGYATATLTNTSDREVSVTFPHSFAVQAEGAGAPTLAVAGGHARVAAGASVDLTGLPVGTGTLASWAIEVAAARPVIVVTATLPTTPAGVAVVSASDGG